MIKKILASCFLVWLTIAANVIRAQNAPANFHLIDNAARERSAQVFERHASSQPLDGAQAVQALRIEAVERGSQADTLGLRPGEFLLSYDGKPFASAEAFPAVVQARAAQPGSVPLQVLGNGGQVRSVTAAPGRMGVVPRLAVWRAPVRAPQGYGVSVQSGQATRSMETDRSSRWAASYDLQGNVKVWDLERQRELTAIPSRGQVMFLRMSPSGAYTLVQTLERLFIWHNLSGALVWERKIPVQWSADWGTDDTHVWVDEGKNVSLWHVPTDLPVGFWPTEGRSGVAGGSTGYRPAQKAGNC